MAQLCPGRVIRMTFGGGSVDDAHVLERLLESIDGINGFVIDFDSQTVTAFADEPQDAENDIVRALLASGMYPIVSSDVGADGTGRLAC